MTGSVAMDPVRKISVIIPAYNCAATISKSLAALSAQDHPPGLEIIVVDDGSTDQTAAAIQAFPQVKYFYQPNAGPAAARNRGAAVASGEILFFTDSDCVPHKDWVLKMIQHFTDPQVAAVAGSYGIANPQSWLASGIHAEIMFRHHRLMPLNPKAFGSYNVAIRREIFQKVGGFDTSYRYASGEDNDLSYKIGKSGYKIYFERSALVDHHHTESLGRYLFEQFRHGFWRAKMYREHPDMARGDDYTFFKDIIEMPLAVLNVLMFMFFFLKVAPAELAVAYLILFIGFELYYAARMIGGSFQPIVFSIVMFLRAHWRLAGFLAGITSFFSPKTPQKV